MLGPAVSPSLVRFLYDCSSDNEARGLVLLWNSFSYCLMTPSWKGGCWSYLEKCCCFWCHFWHFHMRPWACSFKMIIGFVLFCFLKGRPRNCISYFISFGKCFLWRWLLALESNWISSVVNAKPGSAWGCHLGGRKTAHFRVCICTFVESIVPGLGDVTFSVPPQGWSRGVLTRGCYSPTAVGRAWLCQPCSLTSAVHMDTHGHLEQRHFLLQGAA